MKIQKILSITALLLLITSCSEPDSVTDKTETPQPVGSDYLITIKTDFGEMKAILYDETPKHKENFLKLVGEGFYDDQLFHRVISGFMIQGGDPDSKLATPEQRLGAGGPGYKVPAEFVPSLFHVKGALSAARQPDQVNPEQASSGSQFYIVQGTVTPRAKLETIAESKVGQAYQTLMRTMPEHELAKEYQAVIEENKNNRSAIKNKVFATTDRLSEATGVSFKMAPERIEAYSTVGGTPFLDDQYTVFGRVISGLEIIDQIAAVKTGAADRPEQDVRMLITAEKMTKAEIIEQYGNPYGM